MKQVVHLNPGDELTVIVDQPAPPPVIGPPIPAGSKVIDVSTWQGVIDWAKVINVARVSYAMIRATNGTQTDNCFAFNWQAAKSATIKRGAYHYYQNEIGAMTQADSFVRAMGGDFGELPWALDIEDQSPIFTKAELVDVQTFMEAVSFQTGKRGYIYTGASVWKFPAETWATDYQLWFAAYNTTGYTPLPPWPHPCLWQHSSRGVIPGITSNTVDLNTAGDGLTPIKPDWYWRGCTSETKDALGAYPPVYFVKSKVSPIDIYDSPSGDIIRAMAVTWRMTVSAVTADGWLKVHADGAGEWWVKSGDVQITN